MFGYSSSLFFFNFAFFSPGTNVGIAQLGVMLLIWGGGDGGVGKEGVGVVLVGAIVVD